MCPVNHEPSMKVEMIILIRKIDEGLNSDPIVYLMNLLQPKED
jgi:hypothetical protein